MRPTADMQWDLREAMERDDMPRIIDLTSKYSWNWNELAISAARKGNSDLVFYFLSKGATDIYGIMYNARIYGNWDLYDELYKDNLYKL